MLDPINLQAALTAKRDDFHAYGERSLGVRRRYAEAWATLRTMPMADIFSAIESSDAADAPGARPTTEWGTPGPRISQPGPTFASHADAHAWAAAQLHGRLTISADGSQIEPLPDVILPVAVVQVALFWNPHHADVPYRKQAETIVLSPLELADSRLEPKGELVCRRFEAETSMLADAMEEAAGHTPMAIAFYDGPLVVHFAERAVPEARMRYLKAIQHLLTTSRKTGIPVVGYIDSSQGRDLATLTGTLYDLPVKGMPSDPMLVADDLAQWGQRTAAVACAHGKILDAYQDGHRAVGVTYLRAHSGLPCRVEFPLWVAEKGLLPEVMAVVLAEVVAGQGYPYALEVADATAVLSIGDRQRFERTLEAFAAIEGIPLPRSHKAMSKGRRR